MDACIDGGRRGAGEGITKGGMSEKKQLWFVLAGIY